MEVTLDQTYLEKWVQSGWPINVAELPICVVINECATAVVGSNTAVILLAVCVL